MEKRRTDASCKAKRTGHDNGSNTNGFSVLVIIFASTSLFSKKTSTVNKKLFYNCRFMRFIFTNTTCFSKCNLPWNWRKKYFLAPKKTFKSWIYLLFSQKRENFVWIENIFRIHRVFQKSHLRDRFFRFRQMKKLRFLEADSVLGRNRSIYGARIAF